MSELPKGWAQCSLGDISNLITKGTTPTTIGFPYEQAGIPFVKIENIDKNKIQKDSISQFISNEANAALTRSQLQANDILFSIAGTIGKTALVRFEDLPANTNQAIAIIRVPALAVDYTFLQHQLSALSKDFLAEISRGGAMSNVSLSDIKSFELSIPPLAEQTRIAAKLDELLAQVDTLKARIDGIPALLKRFRQSVLAAAVSGGLTEEWRERSSLPSEVSHFKLGNIARFIDYRGKTPTKVESGIPLITAKNIRKGYVSREPREYIRLEDYDSWMTRGIPNVGDVLITTEAPLGNVARIDIHEKFALAQRAICLQFNKEVNSKFAAFELQSPQFQEKLLEKATGTTVKGIKASVLKQMDIACPSLAEQTEIVRRVEQLFAFADQLEAKVNAAQQRIDLLTQSILAKAFRGELVPQDPNDEPASVLLERIKAQRAAAPKAKRGKKASA